jgi:hypothetical protein
MKNITRFKDFKLYEDGEGGGGNAAASSGSGDVAGGGMQGGSSSYPTGGGMGAIKAPQPSSIPGETGTKGSGDLPAYDTGKSFKHKRYGQKKNKKKEKSYDKKDITGKTTDEKSTMYVTKYTDWVNVGEKLK